MNEQQLGAIEARWLHAHGGPWTIVDDRNPRRLGVFFATEEEVRRFTERARLNPGSKPTVLQSKTCSKYEEAKEAGVVANEIEWMRLLEQEFLTPLLSVQHVFARCRQVYCMTVKALHRAQGRFDQATLGEEREPRSDEQEPAPTFLVIDENGRDGQHEANVEFVRHAPEDVGVLIAEVRGQAAKIAELGTALREQREVAEQASRRAAAAVQAVAMFKASAQAVVTIANSDPPEGL